MCTSTQHLEYLLPASNCDDHDLNTEELCSALALCLLHSTWPAILLFCYFVDYNINSTEVHNSFSA